MNNDKMIKCAVCGWEISQSQVRIKDSNKEPFSVWEMMRRHYMRRHAEVHDQITDWIKDSTDCSEGGVFKDPLD